MSWYSISNILSEDNQYAYAKINGVNKGTSRPKTITLNNCNFDIGSFDPTLQELVIEYKLYVDEGATGQVNDQFSHLKQPTIQVKFYDGTIGTVNQTHFILDDNEMVMQSYLSDYISDLSIVSNRLVDGEINVAKLKNDFSVTFDFDYFDSHLDQEAIVMLDYVKIKVVSRRDSETIPYEIGGVLLLDEVPRIKTIRNYSNPIEIEPNTNYIFPFKVRNVLEDEYVIVYFEGVVANTVSGITCENGYVDWINNHTAIIHPSSSNVVCQGDITVRADNSETCRVTITSNYDLLEMIAWFKCSAYSSSDSSTLLFGVADSKYVKSAYRIDVVVGKGANSFTLTPNKNNHFLFETLPTELGLMDDISYIGSVRLHRGHDASVTNNTSNSLIEEKYQNRAYYGKKGDWNEEISMKLRLPWRDVVTLQNHTYHDAPIPIDIYPHLPHGDPLNHRGWAEIYEVANIKKINDMLYECEPKVKYLTHDLIGKFNIEQLTKVCPTEIDYNLTSVHNYTDDLRDKFALSYYKNFYNLEIDDDKYKGVYKVDSDSTFTFTTIEPVKSIADYSFRWRNILMRLDSQAHDNPHWEMAFRVLNHETGQMLFEYLYYNFRHYNDSTDELLNECDVKVTSINANGEYDVTNYTRMNLDFDDISAVAYEDKSNTSFRIQSEIDVTTRGQNINFQLIDWNGQGVPNAEIILDFFDDYGEVVDSRSTITQLSGYANFEFNQNDGNYKVRYRFLGNDTYNECYAESSVTVALQTSTSTLFSIEDNQLFTTDTERFRGHLQTASNVALANKTVYIYLRTNKTGKWKSTPYIKMTDANGDYSLAIRLKTGLYQLKSVFYGDNQYDRCEEISNIRVNVGKGTITKLSTTDMHITPSSIRSSNKFYAVLTDEDNNPIQNQKITFTCYNNAWKNVTTYERTTDSYGKCELGINWTESGVYTIDTSYDGVNNKYQPCNNTNTVFIESQGKQLTQIIMNDLVINDCNHHELYATLKSENEELLVNYPIRFDITYSDGRTITYTKLTNKFGVAELNINLKSDKYNVKATFEDTDNYKGSTAKSTMVINRPPNKWDVTHNLNRLIYDGSRELTITFTDKEGTKIGGLPIRMELYGANNEPVSWTYVQTTDSAENTSDINGQFSFKPIVASGDYRLHIINYCYSSYNVGESEWLIHIDNGSKLGTQIIPTWSGDFTTHTVPVGETSDIAEVYLKDENGYPLSNKTVHFIFDGSASWGYHDYVRVTDGYGKCGLGFRQQKEKARSPLLISFDGDEGYSSSELLTYVVVDRDSSPSAVDPSTLTPCELQLLDYTMEGNIKKVDVTEFPSYFQVRLVNTDTARPIASKSLLFTVTGENNERALYSRTTNQDGIATLEFTTHSNNTYPVEVRIESDSILSADSLYFEVVVNVQASDSIDNIDNQAVISRNGVAQGLTILETPNPVGYDGAEYGSTLDMYFNNNVLEIHDYGLAQDTQYLSGKINRDNIILPSDCEYDIEVATTYSDALDLLVGELTGTMQVRIYEILSLEQYKKLYSDLFVSPSPLLEYQCVFTRNGEDGKQYYYDGTSSNVTKRYRLSPFLQYKGGVNLETEDGISLFNIENAHSPIIVNNGLVKLAFHRRSGFVYLYKYNYSTYQNGNDYIDNSSWILVRTMKIKDYDNFTLDYYTSDKVSMTFGNSTFTMWRGRPFVEIKHPNQDIEFLKQVDTVFCEVNRNQFNLAMVDELDVNKAEAEFRTNNGLNLLEYDMGLNEDININSFENSANMRKELVRGTDDEFEIKGTVKAVSNTNYISFPNQRILKPNGIVTLLIDRLKTTANNISISVIGYSKVDSKMGVFGETKTVTGILHDGTTNRVRMTFDLSNFNYQYIAFAVNLNNESANKYVQMSHFMLSEGTVELDYEMDDTKYRYDGTTIHFDNNYYANFYNKSDDYGLCVCRPYFDPITIGKITASPLTVLIPYMKKDKDFNSPSRIIAEYLFFKDQVCKLLGENYGI